MSRAEFHARARKVALHVLANARAYPRDLVRGSWSFIKNLEAGRYA
jgi:hypothetical protein